MITIRSFISQSLIGLAFLSATAVFTQTATAETITAQSGDVRAQISYDKPEEYQYKNVRLKIIRAAKTVLEQKLPQENEYDRPVGNISGQENKLQQFCFA